MPLHPCSLNCPHYTFSSRRTKQVEISFKTKTRGAMQHLAIDATGLKVYGEGEWKVKNTGQIVGVVSRESFILKLIQALMKSLQLS